MLLFDVETVCFLSMTVMGLLQMDRLCPIELFFIYIQSNVFMELHMQFICARIDILLTIYLLYVITFIF